MSSRWDGWPLTKHLLLVAQMIAKFCVDHPERCLLAFVYGHLGRHDLLRVRTDAEKFALLAALNLVECVAYVGARLQFE